MPRFNAKKWVQYEVEALIGTYTDKHHTPTTLEEAEFVLGQLQANEYRDELSERQTAACIKAAKDLIKQEKAKP